MKIRDAIVDGLYGWANALCLAADWVSREDDRVWRERAWRQWDALRPRSFETVVRDGYGERD